MTSNPRRLLAAALALAVLAPPPARACSMCRCDDPAHTLAGSPLLRQRAWSLGLESERFAKDQVSADDPTLREGETELRWTLSGAWTPLPRLTLQALVPFADRTLTTGPERVSRAGLSDPELTATLEAWHSTSERPLWLAVHAGARLPLGANDLAENGARLDEHLQPGTGAAGATVGITAVQSLGEHDGLFAGALGRWNGTNAHGYHYGDAIVAHAGWQHEISPWLEAGPTLDFRAAARDAALGVLDPNTGGALLYLTPRAELRLGERLALRLGLQVPVARQLYGDQREKVNVQTGLALRR